jgi:SAM-dependent methyltransferase
MDWQARYEGGDTPWDEGEAHPGLRDFIAEGGGFEGRILVPGCGRGHDVRAVSNSGNQVVGLDIAPGAISAAREYQRIGNEEYVVANLFDLRADWRGSFDWVVEHTCFCAIDPAMRPGYVAAVTGALKPGGRLFAIFYLDPARENQPPFGVTIAELDGLFSQAFSLEKQWVPARTFEGRESRELIRLLRRL